MVFPSLLYLNISSCVKRSNTYKLAWVISPGMKWLIILSCQLELSHQVLHVSNDICKNLLKTHSRMSRLWHLLSDLLMFLGSLKKVFHESFLGAVWSGLKSFASIRPRLRCTRIHAAEDISRVLSEQNIGMFENGLPMSNLVICCGSSQIVWTQIRLNRTSDLI